MTQILPAGCPETIMYGPIGIPGVRARVHVECLDCCGQGCTPVEIHPKGTGELIKAYAEYVEIYHRIYAELDVPGDIQRREALRGKIRSLTPGATDANHN